MKRDKTFSLSEKACEDLEILALATDQTEDEVLEWIIEEADRIFFTVLEKAKNIHELQEAEGQDVTLDPGVWKELVDMEAEAEQAQLEAEGIEAARAEYEAREEESAERQREGEG